MALFFALQRLVEGLTAGEGLSTVRELSAALAREPGRVDLAIALAEAHGKEGRWTQGLALARQAAQLHPDNRDLARCRVGLLVGAQQWRLAVQDGVSLLGSMPDHAAVWALVARAFSRLGEVQTAIDAGGPPQARSAESLWMVCVG